MFIASALGAILAFVAPNNPAPSLATDEEPNNPAPPVGNEEAPNKDVVGCWYYCYCYCTALLLAPNPNPYDNIVGWAIGI